MAGTPRPSRPCKERHALHIRGITLPIDGAVKPPLGEQLVALEIRDYTAVPPYHSDRGGNCACQSRFFGCHYHHARDAAGVAGTDFRTGPRCRSRRVVDHSAILEDGRIFFRALILQALASCGIWRAASGSSIIFGLMHVLNLLYGADFLATLLQAAYAGAMGFGFAAVTLRTGPIWPLIVIHALIDFAGFVTAGSTLMTSMTSTDTIVYAPARQSPGRGCGALRFVQPPLPP